MTGLWANSSIDLMEMSRSTEVAASIARRDVLGIVGLLLGLAMVGMAIPAFIPQKEPVGTLVKVGTGSLREKYSSSGNIPGVSVWSVHGKRLGHAVGTKKRVYNGSPVDILVKHYHELGQPLAEYISITNGGIDAICVAYIGMKWNNDVYGWIGDVGGICGADWYYTDTVLKSKGGTPTAQFNPKCIWIDRDRSSGFRTQGISMHITDFDVSGEGRKMQYAKYPETMCSRPRFHAYEYMKTEDDIYIFDPPLEYGPGLVDKDIRKVLVGGKLTEDGRRPYRARRNDDYYRMPRSRPISRRQQKLRSQFKREVLVVSGSPYHKAEELCQSRTSVGPDFVSLSDNLFCDMEHREVWPLCSNGTATHGCFDVEERTMKGGAIGARDSISGRAIPRKSYRTVTNW
ncbi:hypothetical protein D8B26_007448 [Coccidioides posadasii str. Silveira]|uniref:Uncharacterized protein n=1 Tax=Coccidioides posadasii RMSCC 3488 TaxID=454284 RepID=A0A0J6FQB3_COCPO|nr:hypothetical protein CPAG_07948 [Coccidioides posadasii RMSCC 3488]QVM12830.1 hypothetical protein D8B26_007448 [Coccidioides posadasii str. Silveira]